MCNTLEEDALVSELMDTDLRYWNRDKICQLFSPCEASKILSTPLSIRLPGDKLSEENDRGRPSSSNSRTDPLWKEIWRAKIPNTVKKFIWCLSQHILPTRANLSKILLYQTCPLFHIAPETYSHLFLECNLIHASLFVLNKLT